MTLQKHKQIGLSRILQGESTTPPLAQENTPLGFISEAHDKETAEENPKKTEASSQKAETSQSKNPRSKTSSKSETPSKSNQTSPPSSSTIPVDIPKTAGETQSSELGRPIASLTPIQLCWHSLLSLHLLGKNASFL
jgi:hypothetical protein